MSDSLQIYHEICLLAIYLEISEFVIKFFFYPLYWFSFSYLACTLFGKQHGCLDNFFFFNFLQVAVIVDYIFAWSDHLLDKSHIPSLLSLTIKLGS